MIFVYERHSTLINGYVPILREAEGMIMIALGLYNCGLGTVAPITNSGLAKRGVIQLEDGATNLLYSPIIWMAVGAIAYALLKQKKAM